jgi:dipeptidyl aminopeptidase/acylaminoacyl peptidase
VQSVACFFPATDLLNLGASTENAGDGGPPKSFRSAFREAATNLVLWAEIGRDLSPIYHVHAGAPPVLIIHGDADTLIPLDQSERFRQRAREVGMDVELLVRRGKGHGWPEMVFETRRFADWFEVTLLAK